MRWRAQRGCAGAYSGASCAFGKPGHKLRVDMPRRCGAEPPVASTQIAPQQPGKSFCFVASAASGNRHSLLLRCKSYRAFLARTPAPVARTPPKIGSCPCDVASVAAWFWKEVLLRCKGPRRKSEAALAPLQDPLRTCGKALCAVATIAPESLERDFQHDGPDRSSRSRGPHLRTA